MEIATLSIKQTAGQRLMVGFDGTEFNDDLRFLIDALKVGGIILFARNIVSPEQLAELCRSAQAYTASCGQPPLFIAVDQEGGQVARLKKPFTEFPGNPHMRAKGDAAHFARVTASELGRVGINMDMAPVMDVAPADIDSIMAKRAFGSDPAWVADLGLTVIEGLQQKKIMAVAKHFPGIGRTVLDSHLDLPDLDTPLDDLQATDLVPFQAAIDHGVAGIMLSHIRYADIDPEWPASLSPRIANALLREQMGYDGIVMTDDLDMGAIKPRFDISTAVRRILDAEIDIVLICHKGPDIETAFQAILNRIEHSERLKESALRSVARILRTKQQYM